MTTPNERLRAMTPQERYRLMYGDEPIGATDDYDELVRMRDELRGRDDEK